MDESRAWLSLVMGAASWLIRSFARPTHATIQVIIPNWAGSRQVRTASRPIAASVLSQPSHRLRRQPWTQSHDRVAPWTATCGTGLTDPDRTACTDLRISRSVHEAVTAT